MTLDELARDEWESALAEIMEDERVVRAFRLDPELREVLETGFVRGFKEGVWHTISQRAEAN
jgi:hypothetical protein